MTDRLTPERLAELREQYDRGPDDTLECLLDLMACGHDGWLAKGRAVWMRDLKAYQADHMALVGEIDRLNRDLAKARQDADSWQGIASDRHDWHRLFEAEHAHLTALAAERDRLAAENEQLADLDAAATRRTELQAERDRAVKRWHLEHERAQTLEAENADLHRRAQIAENALGSGRALTATLHHGADTKEER